MAEFARGRVCRGRLCQGPSLLGAEMSSIRKGWCGELMREGRWRKGVDEMRG